MKTALKSVGIILLLLWIGGASYLLYVHSAQISVNNANVQEIGKFLNRLIEEAASATKVPETATTTPEAQ